MEKKELIKRMENLQRPEFVSDAHSRQLKLTLLNTRKSAAFGVVLILIPFLFVSGMILKYNLGFEFGFFTTLPSWIVTLEQSSPFLAFLVRFVLLGGPLIAAFVNLLAILHFQFDGRAKEIQIAIKLKWHNLAIIAFCGLICMIFFVYLLVENVNHP